MNLEKISIIDFPDAPDHAASRWRGRGLTRDGHGPVCYVIFKITMKSWRNWSLHNFRDFISTLKHEWTGWKTETSLFWYFTVTTALQSLCALVIDQFHMKMSINNIPYKSIIRRMRRMPGGGASSSHIDSAVDSVCQDALAYSRKNGDHDDDGLIDDDYKVR